MKRFICSLLLLSAMAMLAIPAKADIQDPPMNEYGVTRKLGRGISNILFGMTEIPMNMMNIDATDGDAAAWSYGAVRGVGRGFFRFAHGWYEVLTFPFPTEKGTYKPSYRSEIPWINSGYQEFPPELGWESRYSYCRHYDNL